MIFSMIEEEILQTGGKVLASKGKLGLVQMKIL